MDRKDRWVGMKLWVVVWWIGCVEKRGRGIGEVVVVGWMCRSFELEYGGMLWGLKISVEL